MKAPRFAFLSAAFSLVLAPYAAVHAQTPGIVTDDLEANHDTDDGANAVWENVGGGSAGVDRDVGLNANFIGSPATLHRNIGSAYDLQGGQTGTNRSLRLAPANPDSYGEILGNAITTEDASFEIWFKPPTFDTAANNNDGNMRHRILWETGGGTGTGFVMHGSNLYFASRSSGNQAIATADLSALGIGPDEFVQAVGVVRTQANDGVDLYVNGQLVQTTPVGNLSDWDGGDGDAIGGRGGANLGGYGNGFGALDPDGGGPATPPGGHGWRSFGGEIAIFRFYSAPLDAAAVSQNFDAVVGSRAFSAGAGNWDVGGTWDGGATPATTDTTVFVGGGNNVTVAGGTTATVDTLAIGHQSGPNAGLGTVTVAGTLDAGAIAVGSSGTPGTNNNLNVNNGGIVNVSGDVTFGLASDQGGNIRVNNGGTLNVSGSIIERVPNVNTAQLYINGGTLTVDGDISAQSFRTGDAGGSTASYTQPAGQTITNTGTFFAGNNGVGTHTVDGGTLLVDNSIRIAEQGGGAGSSLIIDGGTVHNRGGNNNGNTNKQLDLARRGDGTVVLNDGTFTNDATIRFGNDANTTGSLTINGGTFIQNGDVITGNANNGNATSTINVDGGTLDLLDNATRRSVTNFNQSAGETIFRVQDTTAGPTPITATNVNLSGGTITPQPDLAPSVNDGSNATWTGPGGTTGAPVSGAWDASNTHWETTAAEQLRPDIGGGTLSAGANFTLINYGTLSGTPTSGNADWSLVDSGTTIDAQYNGPTVGSAMPAVINGAGVAVTRGSDLHLSPNTFGVDATQLDMDAASLELTGASNLELGGAGNVDAIVNLNNGASLTVGGDVVFGPTGQRGGILNINGGSTLAVGGNIAESAPAIPNAQLHLNSGTLDMTGGGSIVVQRFSVAEGAGSNAAYTTQGDITTTGTLNIAGGGNANGTLTVNDAGHTVEAANLSVAQGLANNGSDTADGTLNLVAGALNVVAGNFNIAGDNQADTGVTGRFTMGNGTTSPTVNVNGGNSEWGHGGNAVVEINSGTYNQNTNNIVIAQGASSSATVNVSGGTVNTGAANDLNFNRGTGRLTIDGGTFNVGRNINMGNNGAVSDMQIDLDSGTLSAGQDVSYRGNGGRDVININGGEFIVSRNINFGNQTGGDDQFNHNGGTVRIRNGGTFFGDYEVGDDAGDPATFSPGDSPGLVNISGGFSLNSDAVIQIEIGSDGAGSAVAGTHFDKIIAGGAIDLAAGSGASSIALTSLTTLVDLADDGSFAFVVLEGATLSGEFANLADGARIDLGGATLEAEYTATSLNLVVVPEPSAALLFGLAALAFLGRRRRP